MTPQQQIALNRYQAGEKPSVSTFIDEDTIILGYGKLDYDFEFPLPAFVTVKEYGTQSWKQWFRLKGVAKYLTINKETGEKSITPYLNDEELENNMALNPNFTFEKV